MRGGVEWRPVETLGSVASVWREPRTHRRVHAESATRGNSKCARSAARRAGERAGSATSASRIRRASPPRHPPAVARTSQASEPAERVASWWQPRQKALQSSALSKLGEADQSPVVYRTCRTDAFSDCHQASREWRQRNIECPASGRSCRGRDGRSRHAFGRRAASPRAASCRLTSRPPPDHASGLSRRRRPPSISGFCIHPSCKF